jgi:hypothetical protein
MASDPITYDKADLRNITRAFKAMDDEAVKQAKAKSGSLVDYLKSKITAKAGTLRTSKAATRIAQGSKIVKSSKIGEINLGYASQKFSGGGTTQINQGKPKGGIGILGGLEFGSNIYKQFPVWSGSGINGGSKGWFIYPTLTAEQPYLIAQWEKGFDEIIKEWT